MDEWENEPNRKEFEYKGFKCLVRRTPNDLGHLCGYIELPKDCELKNASYDDIGISVHGGLTFQGQLQGETKDRYFLGFDCAHGGDLIPAIHRHGIASHKDDTYKNMAYVEKEIKSMVDQLSEGVDVKIKIEKNIKVQVKP